MKSQNIILLSVFCMVLNCIPPNQQVQIKTKNDISLLYKSNYYLMMLEEDFLKKQKAQFEENQFLNGRK